MNWDRFDPLHVKKSEVVLSLKITLMSPPCRLYRELKANTRSIPIISAKI